MEAAQSKLIMITGCNKGVGFGILENLASSKSEYKFLMAVRSLSRGEEALSELKKSVPNIYDRVTLKELDISRSESIDSFVNWVKDKGLKIDCLVNNAGIAIKSSKIDPNIVKETFQTNVYGTIELTEKLLPFFPDNAKIVNISTELALFGTLHDQEIQKRLESPSLTREDLFSVAKDYQDNVASKEPELTKHPFPTSAFPAYSFSKLLINVYTRVLANNPDVKKRGIQVYSCSPGWVKTDIGGPMADLTVQQGSTCPCNVINLPWKLNEELQGKFFSNSEVAPLQFD